MMHAVEIESATKRFGDVNAVGDLSLSIPEGAIYGFIGPNGSGKTTTLRMILRIIHPDQGQIRVLGKDSLTADNDLVGYLPEERGLYKKMKVLELLKFFAALKGNRDGKTEARRWLEELGLGEWGNKKVETLSKGMSQKIQFIASIIARPKLLILDEPFAGLDPVNAEVIKRTVLELRKQGTTILFSTHDMEVAERMCDYICMMFKGKKVIDGTMDAIQGDYGQDVVRVKIADGGATQGQLESLAEVEVLNDFGQVQELRLKPDADTQSLLGRLMELGTVRHFELCRPSLRDIFVRIAGPESEEESHE
ncbi:MAG: ATP-binding cassette domain-containing protein [Planctomycetaceae bacterium]|nr:ATP-binding cassette domain-containing protein [Planctomycetaceae bacterium]